MTSIALRTDVPSDDELCAQALAADPDPEIDDTAVCLWELLDVDAMPLLPAWYMPAPMGVRRLRGWRAQVTRVSVGLIVSSFLVITSFGLCNTYGQLHL